MELIPAEVGSLNRFLEEWSLHDSRELEASFKDASDMTTFLGIAQRLRSKGYKETSQEDYLNIITPDQLRFTIIGNAVIETYCRDDTLGGKPFKVMIKDRAGPENNLDLAEYNSRIKIRREIELLPSDPKVAELLGRWDTVRKAFRMIRRWSFKGQGIQIDMSMIRSTQTDKKGQFLWQQTFSERDLARSPIKYEVEVELLREGRDFSKNPVEELTNAKKDLIRGMGEVLRGIHNHYLLLRNSVKTKVLTGYQGLTGVREFRGNAPVTLNFENMKKKRTTKIPNIRDGYNVTDKADGLRMLGYVDESGELYMIDMSMRVYRTGQKRIACADSLVDGEYITKSKDDEPIFQFLLFDIYYAPGKRDVHTLPFAPVSGDADKKEKSRYGELTTWSDKWNDGEGPTILPGSGVTVKNKILVAAKSFLFGVKEGVAGPSIFTQCGTILKMVKEYNTDGVILTPNEVPLPDNPSETFAKQFKWKPAHDNTVDFLVMVDKDIESGQDAIIEGLRPVSEEYIQYKTLRLYVGTSAEPAFQNPRGTVLFNMPLPDQSGSYDPQRGLAERGKKRAFKPTLFNPLDYPDTMANTCYLEAETDPSSEIDIIKCEDDGDIIQDRTIVEMRYDQSKPAGWRWIPIRVRQDKTERFQKGIIGRTMNADKTANGVWSSIHEPITLHMISTGSESPLESEIVKVEKAEVGAVYYDRGEKKEDIEIIKGLRNFHRLYIKENILLGRGLKGGGKTLVDLACGQGGDLWSWINFGARFVYGTDIAGNGITDPKGGAYSRYLNAVMKYGGYDDISKMIFTIGSSSKLISNGEAGATAEEADIMRSVFGRVAPEGPVPPFVEKYGRGVLQEGADCVAIMFAIHYFFETSQSLATIIQNISDSLKIGGLFVGCCFDGQKVFDMLRDVPEGGSKVGKEGTSEIWKITKNYSATDLTTGPESVGLGIDVEFMSIGTKQREYLVPFAMLEEKLGDIGCELLTPDELLALGLQNSTAMFEVSYEMAKKQGEKYPMSPIVKEYSFLNRWFIFKRRRMTRLAPAPALGLGAKTPPLYESAEVPEAIAAAAPAAPLAPAKPKTMQEKLAEAKAKALALKAAKAPAAPSVPALGQEEQGAAAAGGGGAVGDPAAAGSALRTVGVEAPGGRKIYAPAQIFSFWSLADLNDTRLKIGHPEAARWLSLSAPAIIEDKETKVKYPSVEHFIAGMKYKLASNKPSLAKDNFSQEGSIHQEFDILRAAQSVNRGSKLTEEQAFTLLKEERTRVIEESSSIGLKGMKKFRATFDAGKWLTVKDEVLRDALSQRYNNDELVRTILQAAKDKKLYLLYNVGRGTGPVISSDLGGVRAADGTIEGDNKVGKIYMELSGNNT